MTDSTLAELAGILISLAFSYVPGLKEKYAALDAQRKALVMLGALLAACVVIFAAGCLDYLNYVSCDMIGVKALVSIFITAAVANQATYLLTPPVK